MIEKLLFAAKHEWNRVIQPKRFFFSFYKQKDKINPVQSMSRSNYQGVWNETQELVFII